MASAPDDLGKNKRLALWVDFSRAGIVRVSSGKVDLGQGISTAMAQIAAAELDVDLAAIVMQPSDTALSPDEGYTAGSQSIQHGGKALRLACAEVRLLFLEAAATALACPLDTLDIESGAVTRDGQPTGHTYWTLAPLVDLNQPATGRATPRAAGHRGVLGESVTQLDLRAKLAGQAVFIEDLRFDGMLHARVLRQPGRHATLASVDEPRLLRLIKAPIELFRHDNFLAVLSPDEFAAETAASRVGEAVRWDNVEPRSPQQSDARWLLQQPAFDERTGAPPAGDTSAERHTATYSRGYLAHAAMAPSCALARYADGKLEVWTHSQGVFPLRAALARTFSLAEDAITVRHVQGPGCYGHNGADDAAGDAAFIALHHPGPVIRVQWRRDDEFAFEPFGPAMVVTIDTRLEGGLPVDWTTEIWSASHAGRPGHKANLLVAEAIADGPPPRTPEAIAQQAFASATRNGTPLYDIPQRRVACHIIPETPVRTSSLRGLGSVPTLFAIESTIDELATLAGQDPVAYRLALLRDPRARAVIERVAAMAAWDPAAEPGTASGRGIAFSRYKNEAAYAAIVAEVEVDEAVHVRRIWCASDAGFVINPDGAINQLEGGIIQATSWTLNEQVQLGEAGVTTLDWDSYPILRFSELPSVTVELVNHTGTAPSLGVGEATSGATVAAIGNAVTHALGLRIRDLPMTRERIIDTIMNAG
jgi:CO/xanthine dehydrogenase Mo-binding subunit